ncbi:MAG: helix-turn-helix domain-containing protein [Oscillospiraceae bacterium]
MGQLTVGQMAKMNHVTEQTLRFYDRLGLLSPSYRDERNGYRYYDIRQSARLDMIQYLKAMGLPLRDIQQQLDTTDLPAIEALLQARLACIEEQIGQLKAQRSAVERTIRSFEHYEHAPPDGTLTLEYLEARPMYVVDPGINIYDYDIAVYEKILRELKEKLTENGLPQSYFCNAGSILRQKCLAERRFFSTEVFVFVERGQLPCELTQSTAVGNYCCIYCDCFDKEKEYATRLLDYIQKNGYAVAGDYICEVIAELPNTTQRGMFLRLQVPIKFC